MLFCLSTSTAVAAGNCEFICYYSYGDWYCYLECQAEAPPLPPCYPSCHISMGAPGAQDMAERFGEIPSAPAPVLSGIAVDRPELPFNGYDFSGGAQSRPWRGSYSMVN